MVFVAIGCVAAGTWQISRFNQKVHENLQLRANAHRAAADVATVLPLVGNGSRPKASAVEFRQVRATGTYDAAHQALVRNRSLNDTTGFWVLTPLRTQKATLLVVRGFLAAPSSGRIPAPPAAPAGTVTVLARAQTPERRNDAAARLADHQVESINPGEQAARLGGPMLNGYVQLEPGQPGTAGVQALPRPDMSNPAGGALEPQHFAYVIQWYLFALLALAAPFAMARAETRISVEREFDAEAAPVEEKRLTPEELRAARLADRYGRVVNR